MNYKDLVNEMFDFGKPEKKVIEKNTPKKYTLSENIKQSKFYNNMTPLEKYDTDKYIGEEIKLYGGIVGFSKSDSLANGVEVPYKYIVELKDD